jgi:putative MATE family efflux protein
MTPDINTTRRTNNTFITGTTSGAIWHISWPMMLIMLFNFVVGFTDIYVAGLLNPEVQAAVGFVSQLYFLLIIIANAITTGSVALVSRAIGANNVPQAINNAKQSLLFGILCAVTLTLTGLIWYREIIATAGFPAQIKGIAEHFLRIFAFALGPNYILIISNGIFRASGQVKKPLLTMLLVATCNVIGDFVLVFGLFSLPEMGYAGIALATALSVAAGMLINLLFFLKKPWRGIYRTPWSFISPTILKIVSLGWPAALLQIGWNAGSIVLYNILGRLGDKSITALAAITNGLRIEAIIFLPAFALNMAASVLVGQNLGAGHPDRASQTGWRIAIIGSALLTVLASIIYFWAEECASFLTEDPAVLEETTRYLRINMFSEPFMALSLILGGGLQGAGDTRGSMMVIIIGMWTVRLPLAALLSITFGLGAAGVWCAMVISMIVQGALMSLRFHKGHWKTITFD